MNINDFQDIECEQSLLAFLLYKPVAIFECGKLKPDDFYEPLHGRIYDIIQDDNNFTSHSVAAHFAGEEYQGMNAKEYVLKLADNAISNNAKEQSRLIMDYARKRKIYGFLKDCMTAGQKDPDRIVEELMAINGSEDTGDILSAKQVKQNIIKELASEIKADKTGFNSLDRAMCGGLRHGRLYGFAGDAKAGKTTLAHSISHNLDCPHLYIALEMSAEDIHTKNYARQLRVNPNEFMGHKRKEYANVIAEREFKDQQYYINAQGWTWPEIKTKILQARNEYKINGFFLDYLGILSGVLQNGNDTEEASRRRAAQEMANFCKNTGMWGVVVEQLNERTGMLFGSNGLRKACDQLYFICQPSEEDRNETNMNQRWLKMDASRYTPYYSLGSKDNPLFFINNEGVFFDEYETRY